MPYEGRVLRALVLLDYGPLTIAGGTEVPPGNTNSTPSIATCSDVALEL